jgi:hypothetical protein
MTSAGSGMASTSSLAEVVAAHLAEWGSPFVELAIYGHADPVRIAVALDELCVRALGAGAAEALFYQSSVAAVAGLVLRDGRRVIVKAHQPDEAELVLDELVRLQAHVAAAKRLAPRPLAGPLTFANGFAIIEEHDTRGSTADAREPAVRRAIASSLNDGVRLLEPLAAGSRLPPHLLGVRPGDALWPRPHSRLFDFDATRRGAEGIDALAAMARQRMRSAGPLVVGHGDWRVEHLRFDAGRVVLAYDWQSICRTEEAALVGFAAHAFCADWSGHDPRQAPSLEEARAFVADYERARGAPFDREERSLCGAAFAYSVAYAARCGHAGGFDGRGTPGTFHHLLVAHGAELLKL